jgi:hypothetical protein
MLHLFQTGRMRYFLIFLFTACSTLAGNAAVLKSGLKAAMDNGLVRVSAVSTGEIYNKKALKLQLVNNTRDALQLTVEPALIFKPADSAYQDLVLPGTEMLALAPGRSGELVVQTFCGKAHASAPGSKLEYRFKRQGDSVMIKTLLYISEHRLFDGLGQAAIWALTDNHSLEGIIDAARPKESSELLALMVKLTGRPVPQYFKQYKLNTVAGQPVFEKRLLKIVANLEWRLEEPRALTLGIYNKTGDLVQGIFEEKKMTKGIFKMQVQFEAEGAPPGKYFMRLNDGNVLMKEIMVVVD